MIVTDASFVIAALFDDEENEKSEEIFVYMVCGEETAIVPPIFIYEVLNVLQMAIRRKRISKKESASYISLINKANFQHDDHQNAEDVFKIALKHNLTIYDAAYLELAMRYNISLYSLDSALVKAAELEGV